MFKFLNFLWLLKLIYRISKISCFVISEFDFKSGGKIENKKRFGNMILLVLNIVMTLFTYTFNGYLPISDITHSMLMEIGINLGNRIPIYISIPMKIVSVIQNQKFLDILTNLQRNNEQVSHSYK